MQIEKNEIKEKWKPKRWWIALIIFWLISTVGASLIATLISKPHLVERTTSLLAAIPLIIWSMRRSKFFVE